MDRTERFYKISEMLRANMRMSCQAYGFLPPKSTPC